MMMISLAAALISAQIAGADGASNLEQRPHVVLVKIKPGKYGGVCSSGIIECRVQGRPEPRTQEQQNGPKKPKTPPPDFKRGNTA